MQVHEFRRFEGDLLLVLAAEGSLKDMSVASKWGPYVSGEVSESYLPCSHVEMGQPDMLAQAWHTISMGLEPAG
jgi:hypothetical protein